VEPNETPERGSIPQPLAAYAQTKAAKWPAMQANEPLAARLGFVDFIETPGLTADGLCSHRLENRARVGSRGQKLYELYELLRKAGLSTRCAARVADNRCAGVGRRSGFN
jgi:hypothetical protein